MGDILSQEELDALLSQMKDDDDEEGETAVAEAGEEPASAELAAAASDESAPTRTEPSNVNVDMVLNLPMKAAVEIGRSKVTIAEILRLCQGSVIELDHMASDQIDLTVNNKVVALGEAVVINESFGFRVLEVDSIRDRIKKL
jgi:flagellar motor switch protein FliN/FliY